MIRDEMYYQVSGWMTTKLGLKGLKRELYAIIYGFTQDGKNEFSGSLSYLSEWLDVSARTIINIIQELADKELITIIKEEGLKNRYKVNLDKLEPMQKLHNTYAKISQVINNSNNNQYNKLNNNTLTNIKENIKERHKHGEFKHVMLTDEEYEKLCNEYGTEATANAIKKVDEYVETSGKTYRNYYLVLKKWGYKDNSKDNKNTAYMSRQYSDEFMSGLIDNFDDITPK